MHSPLPGFEDELGSNRDHLSIEKGAKLPRARVTQDMGDGGEDTLREFLEENTDITSRGVDRTKGFIKPPLSSPPTHKGVDDPQLEVSSVNLARDPLLDDGIQATANPATHPAGKIIIEEPKKYGRSKAVLPKPYRPKIATSYRDIFNNSDGDEFFCYDRSFLLQPFNRLVYVTQTSLNKEEFRRYAWLLAQSEECWYAMPSTTVLMRMRTSGLEELQPISNPRPISTSIPMIVSGDSLILDAYGTEEVVDRQCVSECNLLHPDDLVAMDESQEDIAEDYSSEDKVSSDGEVWNRKVEVKKGPIWRPRRCEKCLQKYLQLQEDIGWIYLTVVRADTRGTVYEHERNGTGMFMVKRSSSREQAAVRAFYDAGTYGYSTLFCCAIRADVQLLGWKGKVMRLISYVHEVLAPSEEGTLRVFF